MSPKWVKRCFLGVNILLWIFLLPYNLRASEGIIVVSDSSWSCTTKFQTGWETVDFDDSGWDYADAPYKGTFEMINPQSVIPQTKALNMWHKSGESPVYCRKKVDLSGMPIRPSTIKIVVDDDYELYINSRLVAENKDATLTTSGETYSIEEYLRKGTNVIAIKGMNITQNQSILVEARISIKDINEIIFDYLQSIKFLLKLLSVITVLILFLLFVDILLKKKGRAVN